MSSCKLENAIDPALDGSCLFCTELCQLVNTASSYYHMFPFTGLPSPPRAPSYTVGQYGRDNVMITVQWQSPQNDGGAPVNYTITVSPGSTQVTTTETSASLSGIPYNVINTINIVATNCNGSSSAVMETIRIS